MKKLLSISLVAVLAATPLMANAAGEQGVDPAHESGTAVVALTAPAYALKGANAQTDGNVATAGYVKGAYNSAIRAINKVAADAETGVSNAINELDSTKSQVSAETNGWLQLNIEQEDGVIKSITGSVDGTHYDAAGAANQAKQDVEGKLDDGAEGYDINAKTLKIQNKDVATQEYAQGLIQNLGAVATQGGVENTIENATLQATNVDLGVTGTVSGTATGSLENATVTMPAATVTVVDQWENDHTSPLGVAYASNSVSVTGGTVNASFSNVALDNGHATGTVVVNEKSADYAAANPVGD